ncbi:MAG: hypothetical protein NTV05_14310 [Acidobacteria bacterium]|nr:hypothetical protein [Acidobacteriota bacterium]
METTARLGWRGRLRWFGVFVVSLAVAWINFLSTARWAAEPGALHGWRLPWYGSALGVATILGIWWWRRPNATADGGRMSGFTLAAGLALLTAAFLAAFPPITWTQIPFYDDWPGLLQLTANGVELLRHGALTGWNWAFLGGYHTSSDFSQSLAVTAYMPFSLFGPELGFHALLALFTVLVPLAVYLDIRLDGDDQMTRLATGIACVLTAGYFATIMRSGMANSVAGAGFTGLALAGSHAARLGRRWGGPLLVAALTLVLYSHAAFYLYAAVLLAIEALFYRSWRVACVSAAGLSIAFIGALPLHWEILRYPEYFHANNLYWTAPPAFDWAGFVTNAYYATEILTRPWRWFNDYVGAAHIWLPVVVAVALARRSRPVFYAWATLATVLMLRLNTPQLGILLSRELYLYPLVLAPVLAYFVTKLPTRPAVAPAVLLVLGLFVAVPFTRVWHLPNVNAFNEALVEHISRARGATVLLENNPHWNMIATPGARSERSRFNSHYESLLPAATGKRFFGQPQDGFHRSAFRAHSLAGGAFRGRAIADTPPAEFAETMRRWGVANLFVWSDPAIRYLDASPLFTPVWGADPWREYAVVDADIRDVVTPNGRARLTRYDGLGATVALEDVRARDHVVIRTHYYPAWAATASGRDVALFDEGGQLAFSAPADGSYSVEIEYPRRMGLVAMSWLTVLVGAIALSVIGSRRRPGAEVVIDASPAEIRS